MTKKQQIEEMAKSLLRAYAENCLYSNDVAERLYNIGYRKKEEILKKFAERLKEKASNNCFLGGHCQEVVHIDDIDELLKEFL